MLKVLALTHKSKLLLGGRFAANIRRRNFANKPTFTQLLNEKHFNHKEVESLTYAWWDASGYFKPNDKAECFVVPMPPPNVTGNLHMGHAMFVSLQDIMVRFNRMRGKSTLWMPGTDHAGIATQLVVEKSIALEGSSRAALGREAFLERVWAWKREKGGYITRQMRHLGASADWSRERFTLDESMSAAVVEAFVRLHERGLVYRGEYLVNWSPSLQTAVSDLEVEHAEEAGTLYHFRYPLADGSGRSIPVATTRPETILGDVAVCVHPKDDRYRSLVGEQLRVPGTDRLIPVIADAYVDREFGTGAVKITPAHDANDYALGKRHGLPLISIMNKDASINAHGGAAYAGLDRFECRRRLWADLQSAGLAILAEPHVQRVPRSQRGGEVVEPMVSTQWFVRTEDMARRAVEAVRCGDVAIVPSRFEKVWYSWLENSRDWCVSRQLWWGHRIPAYYVVPPGQQAHMEGECIVARSRAEAEAEAVRRHGPGSAVVQDPDVLDTWFSSGLWPFATMGWPAETGAGSDYARFYPATVLETGHDILFFWVARMVMLGLELTGRAPFETVYLHGLVRDGEGRKMSKSLGNVIDPLDTARQMGSDALRYTLVTQAAPGNDLSLSAERLEASRNFVNKLWNAGKYIGNCLAAAEDSETLAAHEPWTAAEMAELPLPERFVLSRCHEVVAEVTSALEALRFADAGSAVHDFLWDEFADWYLEASKARMRSGDPAVVRSTRRVLVYVWDRCLRLLHPTMPFLTEALWQMAPHRGDSLMVAAWPQSKGGGPLHVDREAVVTFRRLQSLVVGLRALRSEKNLEPSRKMGLVLRGPDLFCAQVRANLDVFCLLARVDSAAFRSVGSGEAFPELLAAADSHLHVIVDDVVDAFVPQAGLVDTAKEAARLGKQRDKLQKEVASAEARAGNAAFVQRAPPALVQEARSTLAELRDKLSAVEVSIARLTAGRQ